MRKKTLLLVLVLLLAIAPVFSASLYLRGALDADYMTNSFSDPLPVSGDEDYREDAEFLKRVNLGFKVEGDIFFHSHDTTGLSLRLAFGFPLSAETTTVADPESSNWHYTTSDSLSGQDADMSFALGPVFRYEAGRFDIMLALRLSAGSFDLFDSLTLGIQAEIFTNFFLTSHWFLSAGLTYDVDLIRFIDSPVNYYEEDFTMLSAGGFIGGGYLFGGRK